MTTSKTTKPFRFKHFAVSHSRSAMKVGVDGVLIGCWADIANAEKILDVGTGCGLIALIMAQRCPKAQITGVDIDKASVGEALENVNGSRWRDRIDIGLKSFPDDIIGCTNDSDTKFDLVISNPPYFNSGVIDASTPREMARHQGILSPSSLLKYSYKILKEGGNLAMVLPSEESDSIENEAKLLGYALTRKCLVRGHAGVPWKRVLLQWRYGDEDYDAAIATEHLTLEMSAGMPTEEYRELCRDFYLKF